MSTSFIEGFRGQGAFLRRAIKLLLVNAFLLLGLSALPSIAQAANWMFVHAYPSGASGNSCSRDNGLGLTSNLYWEPGNVYPEGSPPPATPLAVIPVATETSPIGLRFDLHGGSGNARLYYKWSSSPCGAPGAEYCGDADNSTWTKLFDGGIGDTSGCLANDFPSATTVKAAKDAGNGPLFYLLVSQQYSRQGAATATFKYYIPSATPPTIALIPPGGTFANSNTPDVILATTTATVPISSATYTIKYHGPNCPDKVIVDPTEFDYPNADFFNIQFRINTLACGAGDYYLKVSVTDSGFASATLISTYTIVDLTPPAFSGATVDQKQIAYTWTASATSANHFEIWINDPSDPTNAGPAYKTADGTAVSATVDYQNPTQRLPPGIVYHANFFSSATLHACLDSACAGFGISNSTSNYTLANAATSASVIPSSITASFTWLINDNYNQNPQSSPKGTEYRVMASTDNFTSFITATHNQTSDPAVDPNAQEGVSMSGLTSNTFWLYTIDALNGDNVHTSMPADPSRSFWTSPNAPGSTLNPVPSNNSITAGFAFPANPGLTMYVLQAQISDFSQPVRESAQIPQGPVSSTTTVTLSGLTPGSSYIVRACAISLAPQQLRYCGPDSAPLTTSIGFGILVPPPTATSLTAQWTLTPQANVAELEAIAIGADGSQAGSAIVNVVPGAVNYVLTVNNLSFSNTSYTLLLQHIDSDGNGGLFTPINYPNSDVAGLTLAATPSAPKLISGGNAANGLTLTVSLSTDTNSRDSLYAIEITPPSGSVLYVQGDGTLNSSLKWMTAAQWAISNNTFSVPSSATYQARAMVQEKYTDNGFPSTLFSAYSSILTPGQVFINSFVITSGVTLDGIPFGVQTGAPLLATFNVPIDTSSLAGKITISSGTNGTPVPANWIYTLTNGPTGVIPTLSITPPGNVWAFNTAYQVVLAQGVNDIFGYQSALSTSTYFVTVPPLGSGLTTISDVISPLDPSASSVIQVPGNSLPVGGFVVPRVQFLNPPKTAAAGAQNITKQGVIQVLARAEVDIYRCNENLDPSCGPSNSDAALTVTLTPRGAGAAIYNGFDKSSIGLYVLGPQGNLVPVPNSTVNADFSVSAPITQSALYFLAAHVNTELGGSYAYPVPFRPALGHTVITFVNLAADTTIKIYTIAGERVKQIQADGTAPITWDVKNDDGDNVASGVYVYQIKNGFSEKRGKLIIIR